MSFFKKLFGSKSNDKKSNATKPIPAKEADQIPAENTPQLTERRQQSLRICKEAGFRPAQWLPTEWDRQLRPATEIALRLHAIKALVLWLMVPTDQLPDDRILSFVENNGLRSFMTENELNILQSSRDDQELRNAIGWKFENAWPLAWYFGYPEPEITGQMMSAQQMREILMNYTCNLDTSVMEWAEQQTTILLTQLEAKEDLFYCLHNAVRSAQLGSDTVPEGFHPIGNGGVIHERRHSLTWMLSKGIEWDDTDLST